MRNFILLWRREVAAYFLSPIAWVVSVFFLMSMGFSFWLLVLALAREGGGLTVMTHWFGSIFFWICLLSAAPLLTMRLFAEERRSGTLELLLTAPVREAEVVLAKYAAAMTFYAALWAPTLVYAAVLRAYSPITAPVDMGALAVGYIGAFLVGGLFLALKGAAGEEELVAAQGAITKLGGRVEAIHRYALPSGDARVLIVIRKERPTPPQYPRTAALMKKKPLT